MTILFSSTGKKKRRFFSKRLLHFIKRQVILSMQHLVSTNTMRNFDSIREIPKAAIGKRNQSSLCVSREKSPLLFKSKSTPFMWYACVSGAALCLRTFTDSSRVPHVKKKMFFLLTKKRTGGILGKRGYYSYGFVFQKQHYYYCHRRDYYLRRCLSLLLRIKEKEFLKTLCCERRQRVFFVP